MSDTPRITAGYDADAPREVVFPVATRRVADAAPPGPDPALLAQNLAAALTTLCGGEVAVTATAGDALPALAGWAGPDGGTCTIGGGAGLAAALLNRECGGAFEVAAGGGQSPHAVRRAAVLIVGLRDLLAPDTATWDACPPGPVTAFAVTVTGVSDRIDVGMVAPPAAVSAKDFGDWPVRLRGVLDGLAVPVRLVLHEGKVAVRAARALSIGDVIPIATAHEVGLRVGTLALAHGQVIDSETGSPRVRIVARARCALQEQP